MTDSEIRDMIAANLHVKVEYERLVSDEPTERGDPPGVADAVLATLERQIGTTLPGSYAQFLKVRDGFRFFDGGSHILSVADLGADWVARERAAKGEMFVEFTGADPFANGALPIMIGEDSNALLLYEPGREEGERFVEYDIVEEIDTYATLFDYIREDTELVGELVEDETSEDQ